MTCSVVCISRAMGAGGEDVGRLVAERLGFDYVDEEIVSRAAAKAGVDAATVADEEQRKSLVARLLQTLSTSGGEGWAMGSGVPMLPSDEPGGDTLRVMIREAIEQTAARGNVVIVAHAATHALPRGAETLRVFVTASPETRASRLAESGDTDAAARMVKESDAARRAYLKRFYGVDDERPTQYDLVVNTDTLSVEDAAGLVAAAASR
jgi:uncharacterized protein